MKQIEIGGRKFNQIETGFDINDYRCKIFGDYLAQSFHGINQPVWVNTWAKVRELYNKGQSAEALIELYDYDRGLQMKNLDYDCFVMCYALLVLNDGENQIDCSEEALHEKINFMREHGLQRGVVVETVINFMKNLPETFGFYLAALRTMSSFLTADEGETF